MLPLFSITREDHRLEVELIQRVQAQRILCICSGGCTPLNLKAMFPALHVTAFDINPVQLEHTRKKQQAVAQGDFEELHTLNHLGYFARLFRILRKAFVEFLTSESELEMYFQGKFDHGEREAMLARWKQNPYFTAPFHIAFNDSFLHIMFTERATQHAGPGSYVAYFQRKIMEGFHREDGPNNPFLQHIFLEKYRNSDAPPYCQAQRELPLSFVQGTLLEVEELSSYDVVSLSNTFDWSDIEEITAWARALQSLSSGAMLLIRQLNHHRDWFPLFQEYFWRDTAFDHMWQKHDKSLFYDHFRLFVRK